MILWRNEMQAPRTLTLVATFILITLVAAVLSITRAVAEVPPSAALQAFTTRISTSANGGEANNHAYTPAMTADGNVVAFVSAATNLHPTATNGQWHIFIKERQTGQVTLASVNDDGEPGNNDSSEPAMAASGRFVAFTSLADNLGIGAANGWRDVFVYDSQLQTTVQVSIASDGTPGNNMSQNPAISADGRYVVFESSAGNLIPEYAPYTDIFLHDRDADEDGIFDEPGAVSTRRVSVTAAGAGANAPSSDPAISADGRFIVYTSSATNLVAGDSNNAGDIFLYDRDADEDGVFDETGEVAVVLISVGADGSPADNFSYVAAISPDGGQVAFESLAHNLVAGGTAPFRQHIFVRDWRAGMTTLVSQSNDGEEGDDWSNNPALSTDGRFVAFESAASNFISGDANYGSDVFLLDRDADANGVFDEAGGSDLMLVSVNRNGSPTYTGQSFNTAISGNGERIAFDSDAADLIPLDLNFQSDVFLHDRAITPSSGANLSVSISGPTAVLGTNAAFQVTVQNAGPEAAINAGMYRNINSFLSFWNPPSQGNCYQNPCDFGDVGGGGVATVGGSGGLLENPAQVYQGSMTVTVSAFSDTPDPNLNDNSDTLTTDFYLCSAEDACMLDEMVCFLFSEYPLAGKIQGALDVFIPRLSVYYHLRDTILTTSAGQHYIDLYYTHSDEMRDLIFADPALWDLLLTGLSAWEPALVSLVNGEGETATITAGQVAALEEVLDALTAAGSPALRQAIAAERANLPPLETFVGMTMSAAQGEIVGYTVYLPFSKR